MNPVLPPSSEPSPVNYLPIKLMTTSIMHMPLPHTNTKDRGEQEHPSSEEATRKMSKNRSASTSPKTPDKMPPKGRTVFPPTEPPPVSYLPIKLSPQSEIPTSLPPPASRGRGAQESPLGGEEAKKTATERSESTPSRTPSKMPPEGSTSSPSTQSPSPAKSGPPSQPSSTPSAKTVKTLQLLTVNINGMNPKKWKHITQMKSYPKTSLIVLTEHHLSGKFRPAEVAASGWTAYVRLV